MTDSVPDQDVFRARVRAIWEGLSRLRKSNEFVNIEGGGVEQQRDKRLQLHHCANYAAVLTLVSETGENLNLLELGCGSGALSHVLARNMPSGWKLTATDYSQQLLEHARNHYRLPNLEFEHLDARTMRPERLAGTDVVLFLEVLEHLPQAEAASLLHRLYQGLRPGARLILTTLDRTPFPRPFSGYAPHYVEYTCQSLVRFLSDSSNSPFEHFQVYRLVSPLIAGEAVRSEHQGGYLANRFQGLVLSLTSRSAVMEGLRMRATALLFQLYSLLPRTDRFEMEQYLDTLEFVRNQPELHGRNSFGLVAVLRKS